MAAVLFVVVVVALVFLAWKYRTQVEAFIAKYDQKSTGAAPSAAPAPAPAAAAAPASAPAPTSQPVGPAQPISDQAAYTAWRDSLPASTRAYVPATYTPGVMPSTGFGPQDPPVTFVNQNGVEVSIFTLDRGHRFMSYGDLGNVQCFPVDPLATSVVVSETSQTGDTVRYNLWASNDPAGAAVGGDPSTSFQYNTANVRFPAGTKYVNVRALVVNGAPYYIQSN